MTRALVPCNGCTACCQNDLLILHPELGDDPGQYETQRVRNPITGKMDHALQHKPGGGCIYLGAHGCTIWDRAPAICREFDCRRFFLRLGRQGRKRALRAGWADRDVLDAGHARLHTLEEDDAA